MCVKRARVIDLCLDIFYTVYKNDLIFFLTLSAVVFQPKVYILRRVFFSIRYGYGFIEKYVFRRVSI